MRTILLASILAMGCTSVTTIKTAEPLSDCRVTVHASLEAAKIKGSVEELCRISGSSAPYQPHTVETAIDKIKSRACGCGSDQAYVEAKHPAESGPARVTLVAFRYISP